MLIGACNPVACPIRVSWLGLWFTGPIQGVSWSSTFVPIKKKHKHVVRKRRWVRKRVRYTPSAEEQEAAASAAAQLATTAISEPPSAVEIEKKIRAVKKKIRQIEELVQRHEAGETLEKTQVQKIESLPTLQAELASLETQM